MLIATIDVGTNSVKLLLGKVRPPKIRPILEKIVVTRLGEGLSRTGKVGALPAERTFLQLISFLEDLKPYEVEKTVLAGTRAFRAAKNGKELMKEWKRSLQIPARILSGREEARLAFLGACPQTDPTTAIDIGGGSTEISIGKNGCLQRSRSLNMGAVSITEEYLHADPPTLPQINRARIFIRKQFRNLPSKTDRLIGIGGTIATAMGVRLRRNPTPTHVHNQDMTLKEIERLFDRLSSKKIDHRMKLRGLSAGRADILPGGLLILQEYMRWSQHHKLKISSHGLRHGLALDLASR